MKKVLFTVLLLVLFVFASPALALTAHVPAFQEVNPPTVLDWLWVLGTFIAIVVVNAAVGSSSVEVIKDLTRLLADSTPLKWLSMQGFGSVVAAIITSYFLATGFGTDFLAQFKGFEQLDPTLLKFLDTGVIWLVQSFLHNKGLAEQTFKARQAYN